MPEDREIAELRRLHRLRHFQVLHLRIGERLVDRIDRAARHAGVVQERDPVRARLLARHRHQHVHQRVPVLGARLRRGEALVGEQVGALDRLAEPRVEIFARRGDVDVAVLRLEDAGRNAGGMVVAGLWRDLAAHQPA